MTRLRFQPKSLRRRAHVEPGTALTEFVVVIPLFVLLLFWAEFFVDISIVKLKVEEAARYALWETAAQRPVTKIRADLQKRFADLSSPASITSSTPVGTRSFQAINVSSVNIVTNIDAAFDGRVSLNGGGGGGLLGRIINGIAGFIGRAVNSMVKNMGFRTDREARATVEFQVNNTLFPGGKLFYALMDPERARQITVRGQSPVMLVDTWKAWPGPYALSSSDINMDVYQTYAQGPASAPEREVSARMGKVAFFGQANSTVISILNTVVSFTGFPKPFNTKTWRDGNGPGAGPVMMLPGQPAKHSFVPSAANGAVVAVGQKTSSVTTSDVKVPNSPEDGVDHYRTTVPSTTHTPFWKAEGGQKNQSPFVQPMKFSNQQNPYQQMYLCRDAFYLGSVVPGHQRWGNKKPNETAFPSCK